MVARRTTLTDRGVSWWSRWRRRFDRGLSGAAVGAIVWFYCWTVQSGDTLHSPAGEEMYNLLVRGYQKGHLHLDREPPAELLALKDPYDPAANGPYRLPDGSYYAGHYYLYFGVVPAVVLMLPYAVITGEYLQTGVAVTVFCIVGFLAASWLWLALRRRYFPTSVVGTGALGVLVLGMSSHVLALVRRPMVWELPIASGFAFVMLALIALYAAVHGRRPLVALGLAGLSLGLAVASRPPNLFGALMLVPPLWWMVWSNPRPAKVWWRYALAAGTGLAVCGVAMLAHNYARFDHPLEFGQNYQLTSSRELSNRHFGLDFIAQNLRSYYFLPLQWSWEFPFVSAHALGWSNPDYAGSEEMCGLGVTFPFLWLALGSPLVCSQRPKAEARTLRAMLGAIAGLYLGVGFFLLTFFSATERYMAEFAPALALLALLGWLGLERWSQRLRWGVIVRALVVVAALATIPMGVLVSFNYHGNTFSRDNAPLWSRLERLSHEALGRCGLLAGLIEGPRVLKVRFVPRPTGTIETMWSANDPRAGERILIEHLGDRELRFGYGRGTAPVRWGRPLTWKLNHTHTVELQLPSLYGPPQGASGGVRRGLYFRERSSVAVWFSGGNALAEIVDPLSQGIIAGGRIGEDFSGMVRSVRKRLYRPDEIMESPQPAEPRGGKLRLRVILPQPIAPEGEPLFAAGVLYGSDLVVVRDAGEGAVTFGFEHFGSSPIVTKPLRLAAGAEHLIEVTLPSCRAGESFGSAAKGEVILRVNGNEVLRQQSDCHGFWSGREGIGTNPFRTGSASTFRGWILEAAWVNGG